MGAGRGGDEGEFSAAAARSHEKLQTSLSFLMCECVCVCLHPNICVCRTVLIHNNVKSAYFKKSAVQGQEELRLSNMSDHL